MQERPQRLKFCLEDLDDCAHTLQKNTRQLPSQENLIKLFFRSSLVLLLKTFQRLGYFVPYAEIPSLIVSHIARCAGYSGVPEGMVASDASTARDRHMALVRAFIGVTAYGHAACQILVRRA